MVVLVGVGATVGAVMGVVARLVGTVEATGFIGITGAVVEIPGGFKRLPNTPPEVVEP